VPAVPKSLNTRADGGIGGFDLGYNVQLNNFVWGVETDISRSNIAGSASSTVNTFAPPLSNGLPYSATAENQTKIDYLGTIRARVGFAPIANVLFYATGGLAYGHAMSKTTVSDIPQGRC